MIRQHILRTVIIGIVGLAIGLLLALTSPKVYEGRTQLVVGTREDQQNQPGDVSPDVQKILASGSIANASTEVDILRGRSLFAQALQSLGTKTRHPEFMTDFEHYYRLYDVLSDEKSNACLILARMHTPELASGLANEIALTYNETRKRSTLASLDNAKLYLTSQTKSAQTDVNAAQEALKVYKQKVGVSLYESEAANLTAAKSSAQKSLDDAQASLAGVDSEIGTLEGQLRSGAAGPQKITQETAGDDPVVQALQTQLAGLLSQQAVLTSRFESDSTEVVQNTAAIKSVRADLAKAKKDQTLNRLSTKSDSQLYTSVKQQLLATQARRPGLVDQIAKEQSQIADAERRLQELAPIEQKLAELTREVNIKGQAYISLSATLSMIRNRAQVTPDPAQVLYASVPDPEAVAPDPFKYGFIGLLGGFVLGLLYSFLIEASRLRVYTSQQLSDLTGIPVSGTIRALQPRVTSRLIQGLNSPRVQLLESVRYMAYAATANPAEMSKRIMFVGGGPQADSTLAASQFAIATARTGLKVLLIDANLANPVITKAFGMQGKTGLSNILNREMLPSGDMTVTSPTEHENLFVLPAGSGDVNSVKEAWSAHLSGVLNSMAFQVDMIVIDAPNCLQLSDASRLAPYVDEVFVVISARSANARSVSSAYEVMVRSGAPKVSLVMTDASPNEEAFSRQASYLLNQA